jgi:hypothetical protein
MSIRGRQLAKPFRKGEKDETDLLLRYNGKREKKGHYTKEEGEMLLREEE